MGEESVIKKGTKICNSTQQVVNQPIERANARIDKLPLSIEIVDNDSGKTVALTTTKVSLVPIGGAPVPID